MIEAEEQQKIRRRKSTGGYMRAHRLSVDAVNQASLMFDAWKGNKVNLTPGLAHRDPLSFEARISIK